MSTAGKSHEDALSLVRRVQTSRTGWVSMREGGRFRWSRTWKRCYAELRGSVMLLHMVGEQSSRADPEEIAKKTHPRNIRMVNMREVRLSSDGKKSRLRIRRSGEPDIEMRCDDSHDCQKWYSFCVRAATQRSVSLDDFEIIYQVGKGASGRVFLVRDKENNERLALKVIEKTSVYDNQDALRHALDERLVLEMATDHPFILNLRFAFQTAKRLYLVTEYCDGGDLFDYLRKRGKPFRESEGRRIAAEILLALEHIHSLDVVYRDLKLENVLLDLEGHVRIADFGLSKMLGKPPEITRNSAPAGGRVNNNMTHSRSAVRPPVSPSSMLDDDDGMLGAPQTGRTFSYPGNATSLTSTFCGTREYVAPEMLNGQDYGQSVDVWAYGILLYEILCGRTPFYSKDRDTVYEKIENGPLKFPRFLSPEVVSLIQGLLDRNPRTRLGQGASGISAIKSHAWFAGVNWDDVIMRRPHPDQIQVEQSAMTKEPSFGSAVTSSDPTRQTNAAALLDEDTSGNKGNGKGRPDVFALFVASKKKSSNIPGYTYHVPPSARGEPGYEL